MNPRAPGPGGVPAADPRTTPPRQTVGDHLPIVFYYRKPNRYGLMALAGAVESASPPLPVRLHFPRGREEFLARLAELGSTHPLTLAAVSFCTIQAREIADLLGAVRAIRGRELFLVAGGPHPSGDPGGTLRMGFDAVAVGEGEVTFLDLARALSAGDGPEGVRGLLLPGGGKTPRSALRRGPHELDRFPSWAAGHRKVGPIEISRGCPHGCTFCQTSFLFGGMRHRSLENVLGHVRTLVARGITDIRFNTPDAFAWGSPGGRGVDEGALEALLAGTRGIVGTAGRVFFGSFPAEVRPEHVTPAAVSLVRRWCDNDNLVLGAQTGSPRLLGTLRRGHGVDHVRRAVDLVAGAGLIPYVDFILGLPGETEEDAVSTVRLMDDLVGRGAVIHAHTFMPLPGTPLAGSRPGTVSHRVREKVRELSRRGALFGEWHRQARRAAPP